MPDSSLRRGQSRTFKDSDAVLLRAPFWLLCICLLSLAAISPVFFERWLLNTLRGIQSRCKLFCATPMSSRLHNCVRTYRRRSSLGQRDLAFLLGCKDRANVCRYEQGHRLPSLRTALALAAIFDVSIATLFSGMHGDVQKETNERIATLRSELEHKHGAGHLSVLASRQLRWLEDHQGRTQDTEHRPQ